VLERLVGNRALCAKPQPDSDLEQAARMKSKRNADANCLSAGRKRTPIIRIESFILNRVIHLPKNGARYGQRAWAESGRIVIWT
jgi:hypothetical protein